MDPAAIFEQAKVAHQNADFARAAALYEHILTIVPGHGETLHLRGVIELQRQRYLEALPWFERALAAVPTHAGAQINYTGVLLALGRFAEVAAATERALRITPPSSALLNNHAIALNALGRHAEARTAAEQALRLDRNDVQALGNVAEALVGLGAWDEAIAANDQVIARTPGNAEVYCFRATVLAACGRGEDALAAADKAIALQATPEAYAARARALEKLGRHAEGLVACEAALKFAPTHVDARYMRGVSLKNLKHYEPALADFEATLAVGPRLPFLPGESLQLAMRVCRWQGWQEKVTGVLAAIDAGQPAAQPFTLLPVPASARQLQTAAALYFKSASHTMPEWSRTLPADGKIRLGYFSSDFHGDHPVANLLAGLLDAHDRSRFSLIGFAFGGDPADPLRQRMARSFDRLIDVSAMDDGDVVLLARGLGIHIALDLNGPTAGSRPALFDRGVAPIQVNYLGYAGTSGTARYQYVIGDPVVCPSALRPFFNEHVVTLPRCYLSAARPEIGGPISRKNLGLPQDAFVFCCFNGGLKITPDLFDIWMRLLTAVDGSVLWLSEDNPAATANLRREAEARGVASERLHFAPRVSRADHLARHRAADLFLDTFYFNAHSTAIDALGQGLPLMTRIGETFASRVAASILMAAGLPQLIAADSAAYESLALALATQPKRLADLRRHLASSAPPLFDMRGYARDLESAFAQMWSVHAAGGPAADIVIPQDR